MGKYITLRRVLIEDPLRSGSVLSITSKDKLHHLSAVLRLRNGELIKLFNQTDGEWLGVIEEISKKEVSIKVKEKLRESELFSDVKVAFAPIKHDRLRFLIEKCTELGADEFIPVLTERTTSPHIKLDKLNTYIVSAVEQSDRISVPQVRDPIILKKFMDLYQDTTILVCLERSDSKFISEVLQELPKGKEIILLIGPEGGFSEKEVQLLNKQKNVYTISLGDNVLRTETAAIFAFSCVIVIR